MLPDVFLKILLAVFKKQIEIVVSLFNVKKLNNIGMLKILKSFVLILNSFNKISHLILKQLLYILFLNDLASIGLVVIFVSICLICSSESSPSKTLLHSNHKTSYLFISFLHRYYYTSFDITLKL
jgi:hypothetical protein